MKAAAQVSIRSMVERGSPLALIAASSAGRFSGGTRSAIGGRPGEKARLAIAPIISCGLSMSTIVSTINCCEPVTARSIFAVRHWYLDGSRWIVPKRYTVVSASVTAHIAGLAAMGDLAEAGAPRASDARPIAERVRRIKDFKMLSMRSGN